MSLNKYHEMPGFGVTSAKNVSFESINILVKETFNVHECVNFMWGCFATE